MSYVESVLQPGETIVYTAKLSWTTYIAGLSVALLALIVWILLGLIATPFWAGLIGLVILVVAAVMLFAAWFERWTTEIAITTKRIILKRGFIRRDTIEMSIEKVESIDVKQSFLGRLLDYGDITVRGTGVGLAPLHHIDAPLVFRSKVTAH